MRDPEPPDVEVSSTVHNERSVDLGDIPLQSEDSVRSGARLLLPADTGFSISCRERGIGGSGGRNQYFQLLCKKNGNPLCGGE